jgi:hypothetical protein
VFAKETIFGPLSSTKIGFVWQKCGEGVYIIVGFPSSVGYLNNNLVTRMTSERSHICRKMMQYTFKKKDFGEVPHL